MLIGLDLIHLNPEFLPTRPPHDCAVYKHGGMLVGKKHAEGHDRSGLDRMCPVDTPPIEGEVPGDAGSLKRIAGVIHRTLNGKTTKGPQLKCRGDRSRRGARGQWSDLFVATGHLATRSSDPYPQTLG